MTTTAAATCVVAVATYGCHDGSTNATAAGTAIAFPAVVATAHPAYPGRFPINLSQNTINIPPTNTDINPSNTPDKPPFSILARFMLLPSANPTKVRVNYTLALKTLSFLSKFPIIIPTSIGTIAANNDNKGTFARPEVPRAINVKNGPSFKVSKLIVAQSVSSPYEVINERYILPLLFVTALITANVVRPRTPSIPNNFPISIPIKAPIANLEPRSIPPLLKLLAFL